MIHIQRYVSSVGLVLAAMLLLAVIESLFTFRRSKWRKGHLPTNLGLGALTLSVNLGFTMALAAASALVESRAVGPVTIVVGILALDFSTYASHRLMHRIPLLWRAHRVHHADPLVDVTTTFRQHPIEGLLRFLFIAATALALRLPLEVVALYRLISTMNALLEHVNVHVWQPLDRVLSYVIVTPNMHKLHHSEDAREADTNFGNIFSWFDRLSRTFTPSERSIHVRYGLGPPA